MPKWSDDYFRDAHNGEAHYNITGWESEDFEHHKGPPGAIEDAMWLDVHVWNKEGEETAFRLYGPFDEELGWDYVDDIIEDYVYDEDADYPLK